MMTDTPREPLFPLGGPVGPHDLVGRAAFVEALAQRLADGQSVLIAAPRRMGKTSLMDAALRTLKEQGCYTARLDLFSITSRRELAEELADRCLENRTRLRRSVRAIRDLVRAAAGSLKPTVTVQDVELSLSLAREEADEDQMLRDALELPQRLAERDQRRVVIAWDEFQEVTRLDQGQRGQMLRLLRATLQRQPAVSHVFLGSQEHLLRAIFADPAHPFYRFAAELPFPPPPEPDEWAPYLQRKLAGRSVRISRPLAARLAERAGGHPLDTMTLAAAAYYVALELGAEAVDETVLEVAYERALRELGRSFDQLWAELGGQAEARLVARRLAEGLPVTSGRSARRLHPQQARNALDFLERKGLIQHHARAEYRFIEPMFAEYLRRLRD